MKPTTSDVDLAIGAKIRKCRKVLKMSQTALAEAVGVSWQQIQKYESGKNRVSASMLWQVADVLGQPVSFFFNNITEGIESIDPADTIERSDRADQIAEIFAQLGFEQQDDVLSILKSVSILDQDEVDEIEANSA